MAKESSRGTEIMILLFVLNCLNMLDRNLPFILAEAIKADLHLSDSQIGLLGGVVFAVVYALGGLPFGRLADRGFARQTIALAVTAWSVMTALGARLPSDRHSPMLNTMRLAKGFLASAALPLEERYRSYLEVFDDEAAAEMLRAPMAANGHALAAAFADAQSGDDLNRMLAVDVSTQLPDDLLMLTDKMSMAVSLECRVPLLDQRLVALASQIPGALRMRGGELKHVMKRALQGVLPESILRCEKRGFGAPIGAWFKAELAALVRDLLSRETLERRGLLDPEEVRRTVREHELQQADRTDHLLALITLEIWCRLYLDGASTAGLSDELRASIAA